MRRSRGGKKVSKRWKSWRDRKKKIGRWKERNRETGKANES